jgi:hypothetical protein
MLGGSLSQLTVMKERKERKGWEISENKRGERDSGDEGGRLQPLLTVQE